MMYSPVSSSIAGWEILDGNGRFSSTPCLLADEGNNRWTPAQKMKITIKIKIMDKISTGKINQISNSQTPQHPQHQMGHCWRLLKGQQWPRCSKSLASLMELPVEGSTKNLFEVQKMRQHLRHHHQNPMIWQLLSDIFTFVLLMIPNKQSRNQPESVFVWLTSQTPQV